MSLTEVREDPHVIADNLDKDGVACLDGVVASDWLAEMQSAVERRLRIHGEHDHFVRSPQGEEHRAEEALINDPAVFALLEGVMRTRLPGVPARAELTGSALRVIAGPRGEGDAYWFHYDASAITMVVPLFLPDAGPGMSGELVGLFNKRPFRRSTWVNVVDKVVGQSGVYRRHILRRISRGQHLQSVDMKVGNAYLFWGYRSLHANMPVQSGALRATLLLHFGRPHGSSRVLTSALRIQQMLRNLRPAPASTSPEGIPAGY